MAKDLDPGPSAWLMVAYSACAERILDFEWMDWISNLPEPALARSKLLIMDIATASRSLLECNG